MEQDEITKKNTIREQVDVCVIGAGHAGCEAALACARMGMETVIFTVSIDSIALMPCNPNIGGSSKGHLVRELDALGGEMGKNIDKTFIQSKMLNQSKGPAVHSLRAQADKADYTRSMRKVLENQEHLTIKQGEVCELITDKEYNKQDFKEQVQKIIGVRTYTGAVYECKAVIICSGTYLKARCLCGEAITYTGPNGLQAANHLSKSLEEHGIRLRRFKTGTPARMDRRSIDFTKMEEQKGDERVVPFSFSTDPEEVQIDQVSCWLTYTNEKTHEIIRANLDRSPIYAGIIEGTGPRYCPSIEDKVVKFAEKERHQVFIEPEGIHTGEMYVGGMSSSLPEDVQLAMYRTVPGLEHCKIVRNAYAIEYDCLCPRQLLPSLELKQIKGLYCAGQFNGSSGYEEAAAQGLIAGINAALQIQGKEPLILDRSEAYIGVLIDDLVTKDNREPYRMMTSRAEYRLLLRQDNADLRLRKYGYQVGLVNEETYQMTCKKEELIAEEVERMFSTMVGANQEIQKFLEDHKSATVKKSTSMAELICRPELSYEMLEEIDPDRKLFYQQVRDAQWKNLESLDEKENCSYGSRLVLEDIIEQININIKYDGYIKRQQQQVKQFKKMETRRIPEDINYDEVKSLRLEARQKLKEFRPLNVGQASRISGVSPADISVLLVYLDTK
ncbi:MAG: tRNA uridine-5-carboxymethylaminomethyl(34) synthesis enzyme MnmG [Lachnospiraceae bacterium]